MKKWQERATTDPEQLQAELRENPGCELGARNRIGIVGIFVLDVDSDKSGFDELWKILDQLPQTYTTQTSPRLALLYFLYPESWCSNPQFCRQEALHGLAWTYGVKAGTLSLPHPFIRPACGLHPAARPSGCAGSALALKEVDPG